MASFSESEILALAARVRAAGKTIVFTNGVFDLLHPGHVRYLTEARRLGDALIVGVNSDRSVRANKGPDRPITPEEERAEILAALECVDGVVIFDAETPHGIITAIQPDVLVKGADWAEDAIVGRDVVEARGGRVVRVAIEPGFSTTAIVDRIRHSPPVSEPRPYTRRIFGAAAVALALTFAVAFEIMARHPAPFEDVAARAAQSVFLVAVEDGSVRTPLGTAFAVNTKATLATNAHVAAELERRNALSGKTSARAIAIQGGTGAVRQITGAAVAPKWTPGSTENDVALLQLAPGPAIPARKLGSPDEVGQAVRGATVATFGFPTASTDAAKPAGRVLVSFVDDVRPGEVHVGGISGNAGGSPLFNQNGVVVGMVVGDDGWALTATPVRRLLEP
jgi:D-glycero-beta-D-manno-heptose 1-phosphate adenylyltransferase